MDPTPNTKRDKYYQHDLAWRNLTILGEETLAIERAHKLRQAAELDVAIWYIDCAAAVLAPVRWILDTGAPEDLVSGNSTGKRSWRNGLSQMLTIDLTRRVDYLRKSNGRSRSI